MASKPSASNIQRAYDLMESHPGEEYTLKELSKELKIPMQGLQRSLTRTINNHAQNWPGLAYSEDGQRYVVSGVPTDQPAASSLGHDVPDSDEDILISDPISPDAGYMSEWSPGDKIEIIAVSAHGMVGTSEGVVYFLTAQPIEEFMDVATEMIVKQSEREKSF